MTHYRPLKKFFVRKALAVGLITIAVVLINTRYPSCFLWIFYLLLVIFCCGGLRPLLRTHLILNQTGLQGWAGDNELDIKWEDVIYARREEQAAGKSWLVVGSALGTSPIPLELLDADAIWQEVQACVSPEALAEEAAEGLVQAQHQAWEERVSGYQPPFILTLGRRFIWLLVLGILGWGSLGLLAPMYLDPQIASPLLVCISICILLTCAFFLSLMHTLHVDADSLTSRAINGRYQIRWEEVEQVRADPGNTIVVFEGSGKRLITAPYLLGGSQKEAAMEYISLRLQRRQIAVQREARLFTFPVASSRSARTRAA